jgi:hypothetical protein
MRKLTQFWQTIESIPGPAAVAAEWRRLLGSEYDLVRAFLRPCAGLAESYLCPDPKNAGTVHQVVIHGPGHIVGVCPDGCAPARLSRDDIVVWELDHAALGKAVAAALGLDGESARVDNLPQTMRTGTYAPSTGFRFPVYLTVCMEPDEFRHVVDGLLARVDGPFILLAPTRELCKPTCEGLLARRKACLIPLSETLVLDERGLLQLGEGITAESVWADFRAAVLPPPDATDGSVFFLTPADATWEQVRIRLVDGETVSIKVGNVTGVYNYSQMGMASAKDSRPTVQWRLLLDFADENGIIDWNSRKADRRKQKQRQLLAKDLQAFFRIEGDPFVVEGNGWRARFAISSRE